MFNEAFVDTSRFFLRGYASNIQECLNILSSEDIWWRPNENSNSIGNLVLHMLGSLNHFILAGIGGAKIHRARQQEFGERSPIPKEELLSKWNSILQDVDATIAAIDPSQLSKTMQVAGKEVSWMFAIYLTIQHCSMHTGQIILITKSRTGRDLALPQFIDSVPPADHQGFKI